MEQSDTTTRQFAEVLAREPAMSADVHRRAQAASGGAGGAGGAGGDHRHGSLAEALTTLDDRARREVLATVLADHLLVVPGRTDITDRLRTRGAAVGIIGQIIAEQHSLPRDEGWTAGLFHDVGWTVGYGVLRGTRFRASMPEPPSPVLQEAILHRAHAQLAAIVFDAWQVPVVCADGVAGHHNPDAQANGAALASRLFLACRVADRLGIFPEAPESAGERALPVFRGGGRELATIGRRAWPRLRAHGLVSEPKRQSRPIVGPERRSAA